MIYAIVGTYDNTRLTSIRGNGKTITAVYYGYRDYLAGRNVYTNFYTTFSTMVSINDLITLFKNKKLRNSLVIITEAQIYFNHSMKKDEKKALFRNFISQSRKQDNDIIVDTQRFKNLNVELRQHVDKILIPEKTHLNGVPCHIDTCKEDHIINVYDILEDIDTPINSFRASIIGQLYDTNEIVLDEFISEEKKEKQKNQKKIQISDEQLKRILKEMKK